MRKEKQMIGLFLFLACGFIAGCSVSLPTESVVVEQLPEIYPDYRQVTIPPNIAPMNFEIIDSGDADSYLTEIAGESGDKRVIAGKTVIFPENFWHRLLKTNQGKSLTITVYTRKNGTWQKYQPIVNPISADRIDPWLTYRQIEPGYSIYGRIRLEERCLENFKTKSIYDNASLGRGSCANCHHCQNNDPNRSLFHVRQKFGGTMIRWNGELKKIDTVSERSGFAMSYPAWHPTLPLIAYSSNATRQLFHARDLKKIEVADSFSDLMLYDIEKQTIIPVLETEYDFETYPVWQRDGKALYYCVAKLQTANKSVENRKEAANEREEEMVQRNKEIRYSLMKMSFDSETGKFGTPEIVFDANAEQKSFVHPRISPDGRFMVYVQLNYGTFPLTHAESDLWLYDLTTGQRRPMTEINSDNAESFHSWDSSGRWMVFSSRRENGAFTRSYFTHFNPDGTCTKPFLLPQKTPQTEREDLYSHNLPEMMTGPVPVDGGAMSRKILYSKAEKSQTLVPVIPGK